MQKVIDRDYVSESERARGIRNLLIYDANYGADDFAKDPEAWGLKLIARGEDTRLYRTIW